MLKGKLYLIVFLMLPAMVAAKGPGPITLQVELVAVLDGWGGTSQKFSVESGKTAIVNYISCYINHTTRDTTKTRVELYVDTIDTNQAAGAIVAFDAALEPMPNYFPFPVLTEHISSFVSACIGEKCTSLDGVTYPSLFIQASRNDTDVGLEEMKCMISGSVY